MTKIYKSFTQVAFSVTLPGGGSKRISFAPRTGTGSVYYTADERVQKAIESHPDFGRKFFAEKAEETAPATPAPAAPASSTAAGNQSEKAQENAPKEIPFTNLSDAKEYLARHFEIPRTQLRSKESIKKYAALNNVTFVGIDE